MHLFDFIVSIKIQIWRDYNNDILIDGMISVTVIVLGMELMKQF